MDMNHLLNRNRVLFEDDFCKNFSTIENEIKNSNVLVVGAAGTIGKAVSLQVAEIGPKILHFVDVSENNLVELVREVRSSVGFFDGELGSFVIDICSLEFDRFCEKKINYDYVFNLSALKHVRSEKDPFSLMRMIDVNILSSYKLAKYCEKWSSKKYFSVSTDKAANPVNMMGASKRIMELFLSASNRGCKVSFARFANVAFSDGSLLHGFNKRIELSQPLSAPNDISRYFISPSEAGRLCILSAVLGEDLDILFPKLDGELNSESFVDIACRLLDVNGFKPIFYYNDDHARANMEAHIKKKEWPIYTFTSDTTGEKPLEEFFTEKEKIDFDSFVDVGIVKMIENIDGNALSEFLVNYDVIKTSKNRLKEPLVKLFFKLLPEFEHQEKGKSLDDKM